MNRRFAGTIIVLLCLFAAACASDAEPQAGSRSRLGTTNDHGKGKGSGSGGGKGKKDKGGDEKSHAEGTAPPEGAVPDVPGTKSDTRTQSGSIQPPGPPSDIDPSLARASSRVEEPEPDAKKSGLTPDYAEVYVAEIKGLGENVRLSLTLGGNVPERMPDDHTYMTAGFALLMGGDEAYSFGAYADDTGWKTYAGGSGREGGDFPGTFQVDGKQIVMTIPWDYVRGPRSFTWQSNSGWFTQIANQTQYAFDVIPNKHGARFPGQ